MKIQVSKLREALGLLKPAVPRKPRTLKVLSSVRLGQGKLVGTDLDVAIQLAVPEADESFLLPYHQVAAWLKNVPGDEELTLTPVEHSLELTWAGGQSTYPTGKVEDFPPVAEVEARVSADVDGDALARAMNLVASYAAGDKQRPVLNGVCLILGEPVSLAASDGFRMAWQSVQGVNIPAVGDLKEVIVPADTVRALAELLAASPRMAPTGGSFAARLVAGRRMRLELNEVRMQAQFGDVTFTAQLIKGKFPNYKGLIPEEPPIQVRVFGPDMERALKGLRGVAREGSGIGRLVWSGAAMTVSAKAMGIGSTSSIIQAEVLAGGPERVAAGLDRLLDYFRDKQGMVTMGVTNRKAPILFRSSRPPEVLIMPMGVQWEDEKPEPVQPPVKAVPEAEQVVEQAKSATQTNVEPKPKRVVHVKGSKKESRAKRPQEPEGNESRRAVQN